MSFLSRRELTPIEKAGVPKAKIKLNAVFATVHHLEAAGIGAREAATYDTSGSSGQLRAFRPDLPFGCVWCGICNKPADFDEGGMHNLFGKPDKAGYHRGYILLRAMCHGAEADIMLSFEQARQHAGKVILAFPYPERVKNLPAGILRRISAPLALPAPPVRLLLRDAKRIAVIYVKSGPRPMKATLTGARAKSWNASKKEIEDSV